MQNDLPQAPTGQASPHIPLIVFEEHHQLVIAVEWVIRQKRIPAENNRVLHIDMHADMSVPRLYQSPNISDDARAIQQFTHDELTIANFLMFLVYRRRIHEVYWFYPLLEEFRPGYRLFIARSQNSDRQFVSGRHDKRVEIEAEGQALDRESYTTVWIQRIYRESRVPNDGNWILDICLDYFSANDVPDHRHWRLEVSEETFSAFEQDPYHFLKLNEQYKVRAHRQDGRHYFLFGDPNQEPTEKLRCSPAQILKRIEDLRGFLKQQPWVPKLITISRSVQSGYTPRDQWPFIEYEVRAMLLALYADQLEEIPFSTVLTV